MWGNSLTLGAGLTRKFFICHIVASAPTHTYLTLPQRGAQPTGHYVMVHVGCVQYGSGMFPGAGLPATQQPHGHTATRPRPVVQCTSG